MPTETRLANRCEYDTPMLKNEGLKRGAGTFRIVGGGQVKLTQVERNQAYTKGAAFSDTLRISQGIDINVCSFEIACMRQLNLCFFNTRHTGYVEESASVPIRTKCLTSVTRRCVPRD